jgi:hypothetical protein
VSAKVKSKAETLKQRIGTPSYRVQRQVVALMFDVMGRLLEAASRTDPVMQREIAGFPEGLTIGFALLGDSLTMRVRVHEGQFLRVSTEQRPELEIVFKHVSHAFWVLTFQESTAVAFAHERAITRGETALAMRFVRCLYRMQALALPERVVERALKAPLPVFAPRERIVLRARLYAELTRGLLARNAA